MRALRSYGKVQVMMGKYAKIPANGLGIYGEQFRQIKGIAGKTTHQKILGGYFYINLAQKHIINNEELVSDAYNGREMGYHTFHSSTAKEYSAGGCNKCYVISESVVNDTSDDKK